MATFVWHFRTDRNKLDEMLFLRGSGWSYTALAERYQCPKLTIRFLARKNGLDEKAVTVYFKRQDYLRTTTFTLATPTEEKISQGKTYKEYLQEEAARKLTKQNA